MGIFGFIDEAGRCEGCEVGDCYGYCGPYYAGEGQGAQTWFVHPDYGILGSLIGALNPLTWMFS